MKNKFLLILFLICVNGIPSYAQMEEHDNLLGASIGIFTAPAVPTFGFNFENEITGLGDAATLGLGGVLRYTSWRDNFPAPDYNSYNYTTIGVQTNFNFNNIGEGKFVPFVGAVLGYNYVNNSFVNNDGRKLCNIFC